MKWRVILVVPTLIVVDFAWMASNMSFQDMQAPVPLRGEAARNPFYAAIRLSELLGAEATWERVFTAPPADSVIMLSDWNWSLSRTRRERLQRWVEGGGRLIVDDSVMADSRNSKPGAAFISTRRKKSTRNSDEERRKYRRRRNRRRRTFGREPIHRRAVFEADCHRLSEDGSGRKLEVCDVNRTHSLSSERKILWALRDEDGIHALRTAVGRGSVTVINATPFRYRDFLLGDHPRLFVTAAQLHRGDVIMFLTEQDHASLLRLVWRFGAPAVLLFLAAWPWHCGAPARASVRAPRRPRPRGARSRNRSAAPGNSRCASGPERRCMRPRCARCATRRSTAFRVTTTCRPPNRWPRSPRSAASVRKNSHRP